MKKSLYNRIRNKVLGLFLILMPYFFFATTFASPSSHKVYDGSINPTDQAVSNITLAVIPNNDNITKPDSSLNSFISSSQYTINNLLYKNIKPNYILKNALAPNLSVVCPGNKIVNTDSACYAHVGGLAAAPNGAITTLTWVMIKDGTITASSPISGINNILGTFLFEGGTTTITYRVTDSNGITDACSFTIVVNDIEPPTIVCPPNVNITISSCATLTASIKFSPQKLEDNCGVDNFSSSPLLPAQFPVGPSDIIWTAVDPSGNSATCTQKVNVTSGTPVSGTIIKQTNVTCVGTKTGSVTVDGSGGTFPYQYSIDNVSFQASGIFNNLAAGTYNIIIKDAYNCTFSLSVTITEAATALAATITSKTNEKCNGEKKATATVTASGGIAPYTYSWNSIPPQTTAIADSLSAGTYTVTVKDAAGCIVTTSVTITQPTPIVVTVTSTNVACFGELTGTATASASGSRPPYTYAWLTTPIQNAAMATKLAAGTYTVAVFDSAGCYKAAFVTITQPDFKFIATITSQTNVACTGSNTGSIIVSGSGGVAPFQYNINGGAFQPSGTFNTLTAGSYSIIARDANNCTFPLTAIITEPAAVLSATITTQTNEKCNGEKKATATVTASGGTAPYTYSWNSIPPQTTAIADSLSAGTYTVTVKDAAGCIVTASVTITQPTPIDVKVTSTNVACFGELTGTATASASGSRPPYTYAWLTTPIQNAAMATNLAAGTYTVAVFDSAGCYKAAFVTITQPGTPLTGSISGQVNVVCAGNTGSLTATANGGVSPYEYSINGGSFQASGVFNSLSAGIYTITAKDANNCTFNIPAATITEPANALHASITAQTNALCVGDANGSATVTGTNGTAPYTYEWNTIPVQKTAIATGLAAGNYIVTTTDNMGCFVIDTAFITEPSQKLSVSLTDQINFDCATGTNGTVTVAGAGGTPNYQYSLDGGAYQVSGIFTNLPIGNYTITVRDTNTCEAQVPVEIILSGLIAAINDTFITSEDTYLNENVMSNDHVFCNLPITVTANSLPQHGSLTVNADGTFTYIPVLSYNGTDSFDYTITDFVGVTSTAAVTITIDPVNDAPVTLNDSITVKYNQPTTGNIMLNGHFDPDGTSLTASTTPIADPANGSFVIAADGTYTYTPNLNYIGNDEVIISLCDAGIPLPPACTNDTLFIVVLPPNQPPVIVNENIGLCMDGSFIGTTSNGGTVFNGETDPENNLPLTLNITPVQDAAHGTFTITDAVSGTFNYTPNSGYSGSDFIVVSICDSGIPVECSNDTIYIKILIPVVADAGLSQKLCNADIATLVGNSPGTATGSWNVVSGPNTPTISPSTGNVAIASGLIASLTPYVFGYSIDNGGCVSTDTMSVINFIPATPAYAGMDQEFCNATGNLTITLAGNMPANGTGSWSQLAGPTASNILDPSNPNSNVSDLSFGTYTFQWLITNGLCQDNADAVNITVSQSVIVNAGLDLQTCESTPVPIIGSSVLNSTNILWTTTGNGTFDDPTNLNPVYTPGTLDLTIGIVKLIITAKANSPCTDATDFALLTINKKPFVNAGPDEGSMCIGNSKTISTATATDYSTLQWSMSPADAGTLVNAETLHPTFTPAAGFSGSVVLTIQVQGLGSCTSEIQSDDMTFNVNSSLVANAGADQTILPGTTAALSGLVSGGTGFYSWSWQPAALFVNSLVENPVTIALDSDTTFILTVLDITTGCTDEDSVRITLSTTAIPIIAVGDHDTTLVNSSVTINVLANDINPEEDPLDVSICGYPSHGIVVLNSDNTFTYTPYSDYEGDDAFCYRICSTINPNYCADTMVQIRIKHPSLDDLVAYSGISPNEDGINDVWKIKGIEKYPDNTVLIFNRWGDKLREFSNYNNTNHSWNGKNENGDPLPDGTYFYILDVKQVGVLKGWIFIRGK